MEPPVQLLIHIRDLIFSSKVVATARAQSVGFKVVRDPTKLLDATAKMLVIDLNAEGAIETASAWKARHNGQVIGFVSHTAADTIDAARSAGIDKVMSNGAFSANLESIILAAGEP